MPLLGFTKFKPKLKDGSKRTTIRRPRKNPIEVGDTLYLYWKLRTKDCEKLGEGICTRKITKPISEITPQEAVDDGFDCLYDLYQGLAKMHGGWDAINRGVWDIISWDWVKKEWL